MDRIEEIVELSHTYVENTDYNFDEYFEDIIGVTKHLGSKLERIKLWFSFKQAPYILTKPLHGTQKKKSFDVGGLIVTIEVIPNVELKQIILRYGDNCKVLEPEQLTRKITETLKKALDNYL